MAKPNPFASKGAKAAPFKAKGGAAPKASPFAAKGKPARPPMPPAPPMMAKGGKVKKGC